MDSKLVFVDELSGYLSVTSPEALVKVIEADHCKQFEYLLNIVCLHVKGAEVDEVVTVQLQQQYPIKHESPHVQVLVGAAKAQENTSSDQLPSIAVVTSIHPQCSVKSEVEHNQLDVSEHNQLDVSLSDATQQQQQQQQHDVTDHPLSVVVTTGVPSTTAVVTSQSMLLQDPSILFERRDIIAAAARNITPVKCMLQFYFLYFSLFYYILCML